MDSAPNSTLSSSTTTVYSPSLALQYLTQEEEHVFDILVLGILPLGCFPPGVHVEDKPAGLLFPTVWAGQLFPFFSVVSCFVPGAAAGRWENSGAVGTRMTALWREGCLVTFWKTWQLNTSPVWACRCSSRSSFEGKTVLASAQPPTCVNTNVWNTFK